MVVVTPFLYRQLGVREDGQDSEELCFTFAQLFCEILFLVNFRFLERQRLISSLFMYNRDRDLKPVKVTTYKMILTILAISEKKLFFSEILENVAER